MTVELSPCLEVGLTLPLELALGNEGQSLGRGTSRERGMLDLAGGTPFHSRWEEERTNGRDQMASLSEEGAGAGLGQSSCDLLQPKDPH